MNAMAAESWDPQIFLWREPEEEAMAGLTSKRIGQMESDQTFNMYHTFDYGQLEIMQLLESEHFFSYEVSRALASQICNLGLEELTWYAVGRPYMTACLPCNSP